MTSISTLDRIKAAVEAAPPNGYVAELHIQIIKHADALANVSGRTFCEALGIGLSFGTEFSKMRKIAPRLVAAGLDVSKL